jgi:hypothetical protein
MKTKAMNKPTLVLSLGVTVINTTVPMRLTVAKPVIANRVLLNFQMMKLVDQTLPAM